MFLFFAVYRQFLLYEGLKGRLKKLNLDAWILLNCFITNYVIRFFNDL
jgi:hypothetical protein